MFSYFTTQEANNALPEVIRKFRNSVKLKNEIARIQGEIESDPSYFESFEKYIPKKQELNSAIREFYQSIEDLEKTGVTVKSLDEGLVDFPSKRFDEEVWLCWKEGESEIKFWHGKDEGFMGRKPISVSNESLV